jgi:predicted porin
MNDIFTTANTYRIGGEYKVKQISLRGGYRLEESPYANDSFYGDLTGFSLGIGYNFGNTKLDLTYDQAQRDTSNQLYAVGLTDAALLDTNNSNITLTLGFNL